MPKLYPVEIRYTLGFHLVKMSDGNGRTHWLDGRYLSSAVAQAKRKAHHMTFSFCAAKAQGKGVTGVLATILDQPVALIAPMNEEEIPLKITPDWSLTNDYIPEPISYDRPAYVEGDQPRLCESKYNYTPNERRTCSNCLYRFENQCLGRVRFWTQANEGRVILPVLIMNNDHASHPVNIPGVGRNYNTKS